MDPLENPPNSYLETFIKENSTDPDLYDKIIKIVEGEQIEQWFLNIMVGYGIRGAISIGNEQVFDYLIAWSNRMHEASKCKRKSDSGDSASSDETDSSDSSDSSDLPDYLREDSNFYSSCIQDAIKHGNLHMIQKLVKCGFYLGDSLIEIAIEHGQRDILTYVLSIGYYPNIKDLCNCDFLKHNERYVEILIPFIPKRFLLDTWVNLARHLKSNPDPILKKIFDTMFAYRYEGFFTYFVDFVFGITTTLAGMHVAEKIFGYMPLRSKLKILYQTMSLTQDQINNAHNHITPFVGNFLTQQQLNDIIPCFEKCCLVLSLTHSKSILNRKFFKKNLTQFLDPIYRPRSLRMQILGMLI
jgi:hypothetical protein